MSESEKESSSPQEIAGKLDKLLDDESTGEYMFWIPVSAAVKLGMSHEDCIIPTTVSVCRQVLKRFLEGKTREEVRAYLTGTIGYDQSYAIMSINQTLDCATQFSKVAADNMSAEDAMANLMRNKNADPRVIGSMFKMINSVMEECAGKYTVELLGSLQDGATPLDGYYWILKLCGIAAWPVLMFVFDFRWWTGLLSAIGLYFVAFVAMIYIDIKLENKL